MSQLQLINLLTSFFSQAQMATVCDVLQMGKPNELWERIMGKFIREIMEKVREVVKDKLVGFGHTKYGWNC
jgi:hypothetical protein